MSPVSSRNSDLTEIGCSLTPACADSDREALVKISTLLRIRTLSIHQQVAVCGYVSASYEICVLCKVARLLGTLLAIYHSRS
jgi:hypothetical protein